MVTRWGFSDAVGRVALGENQEEVFLGHSVARQQNVSEETARKIDHEVRRLVDEGYEEARRILTEHKDDLEVLAQGLLEFETLTGEEIKDLLKGKRPVREDPSEDTTPTARLGCPGDGHRQAAAGQGRHGAGAAAAGLKQRDRRMRASAVTTLTTDRVRRHYW